MALSPQFVERIARCLDDEEIDVYTLTLFALNSADLEYFDDRDRQRVREIFDTLIKDTRQHMELLKLIVELGSR